MNKYEFTKYLIDCYQIDTSSVLDVGCRDGILKQYLPENITYYGIDVSDESKCDEIVDISQKTTFADNQFRLLIALDVAEHTDNIYASILEMLRIANTCIIALPNMYNIGMRYRFLKGQPLCDKYSLSIKNAISGGYRHRWLFTPKEAIQFIENIAKKNGRSIKFHYHYPALKVPLKYLKNIFSPNLMSEAIYFIL